MKKLFMLLTLLLSTQGLASIDFKCVDHSKRTAFIYDVEKIIDDEQSLEVTALTQFGNCDSGNFENEKVTREKKISRIFSDGWNNPFKGPVAEVEVVEYGSNGEYKLTIKIDKKEAYKKKSKRNFGVHFRINARKHKFIWELKTKKNANGSIDVNFPTENKAVGMSYNAY